MKQNKQNHSWLSCLRYGKLYLELGIYCDPGEYSLYIRNVSECDMEIIRFAAKTACVNCLTAKKACRKGTIFKV